MESEIREDYRELKGGGIRCSTLKSFLTQSRNLEDIDDYPELEIVFILWVLGQTFFPNSTLVARVGWLQALEYIGKAPDYDWGSAILAELYCGLD